MVFEDHQSGPTDPELSGVRTDSEGIADVRRALGRVALDEQERGYDGLALGGDDVGEVDPSSLDRTGGVAAYDGDVRGLQVLVAGVGDGEVGDPVVALLPQVRALDGPESTLETLLSAGSMISSDSIEATCALPFTTLPPTMAMV